MRLAFRLGDRRPGMNQAITDQDLRQAEWLLLTAGTCLAIALLASWMRRRNGPLGIAPRPQSQLPPEAVLVCMVAYLLVGAAAQWGAERLVKPRLSEVAGATAERMIPSTLGAIAGATACLWYGVTAFAGGRRGYGLSSARWAPEVAAGLAGWLVSLPVCAGLLVLCEWVIRWFRPAEKLPTHPALDVLQSAEMPAWLRAVAVVGPIVIAPVAEELFFRGIVQSYLRQYLRSRRRAMVLGAAFFGMAHYTQPQVVLPMVALGLILGYLYERKGSLVAPLACHVAFNLRTIVWQLLLLQ